MTEPISVIASVISIWDLVKEIKNFSTKVKGAPEKWQRYSDGLESLAHVQSVLKDITEKSSRVRSLTVEINGQHQGIVEFSNGKLALVREEANTILNKYKQLKHNKIYRLREWVSKFQDSFRFTLEDDLIQSLIQAIEHAKSTLQSVICLAHLATSDAGHQQTQTLLKHIKDHMAKQSEVLDNLHKTSRLEQRSIEINIGTWRSPSGPVSKVAARNSRPSKQRKKRSKFSRDIKVGEQDLGTELPSIKNHELATTPAKPGPSSRRTAAQIGLVLKPGSTSGIGKPFDQPDYECDGMDYAVDDDADSGDEDDYRSLDGQPTRNRPMDAPQESDYDFICRDNKLIMVSTDSDDFKSSAICSDIAINDFDLQDASTIRVTDLIETMTDDEWEKYVQSDPEELFNFLTTPPCTTTCSDAELNDDESPIKIVFRCQLDALVAQTINLAKCNAVEIGNLFFCVHRLSVTDNGLIFILQEPCPSFRRCKHVTLEGLKVESIRSLLPCAVPLTSIDFDKSLTFKSEDTGKPGSYILPSYRKCNVRKQCLHVLVENKHPNQIKRAFPAKFHASFGEHVSDMSESDTGTEGALSAAGNDSSDLVEPTGSSSDKQTQKCRNERAQESGRGHEFPLHPSLEDDEHAFSILRDVVLKRSSDIPDKVAFDTLLQFLLLARKYNLGDIHLKQAKTWIQFHRSQIPKSFSKEAITWLWILWELQMDSEFKELSGIVQQQARRPIDQEENQYHVPLPKYIIDLIEERRLSVLTRINSIVISEVDLIRKYYLKALTDAIDRPNLAIPVRIMKASTVAGYLTLESGRWLRPNHGEDSIPEFDGVSFSNVCHSVRSMMNLGDWMVTTLPPSERIPGVLATLSAFIPALGVGLHEAGIAGFLPANYNRRLVDLIANLEKEDWGIELAKVAR